MTSSLRGAAFKLALSTARRVPYVRRVPASIRFPLQRDGVDPVARLATTRARGEVVRFASLLGTRVWLVTGYDAARSTARA